MSKKREPIKTTIKEAVNYWSKYQDECGLSVDWSEAHERCWRCGCKSHLQRCHIIPDTLGGKDDPSNIVLLCKRCHADGPNVSDPEIMWDWIRAYGVSLYDTFWTTIRMKEYEFIYGNALSSDLDEIVKSAGLSADDEYACNLMTETLKGTINEASIHFGQPYLNNATMAGVWRMMLKKLAKKLGVIFPKEKK